MTLTLFDARLDADGVFQLRLWSLLVFCYGPIRGNFRVCFMFFAKFQLILLFLLQGPLIGMSGFAGFFF